MMFNLKRGPILYARTRQGPRGFPKNDGLESVRSDQRLTCLHVMQKYGGKGTGKAPRISSSLLALKTETEGGDGFGTWLIL